MEDKGYITFSFFLDIIFYPTFRFGFSEPRPRIILVESPESVTLNYYMYRAEDSRLEAGQRVVWPYSYW